MWGVRPTEFLNDWDPQDQELAVASLLADRATCSGCGFPRSETWREPEDADHEYIAEEAQCLTCARLEDARSGNKTQKGLHYFIERHPRREGNTPDPDHQHPGGD